MLRLKPLSHQVIPICVSEININQRPFSAHKALHWNAGPHSCQGCNNSSFISIKSAFSCQNSNFFFEYSATIPLGAASNLSSTCFSSCTVSLLQPPALPGIIYLLKIQPTSQLLEYKEKVSSALGCACTVCHIRWGRSRCSSCSPSSASCLLTWKALCSPDLLLGKLFHTACPLWASSP